MNLNVIVSYSISFYIIVNICCGAKRERDVQKVIFKIQKVTHNAKIFQEIKDVPIVTIKRKRIYSDIKNSKADTIWKTTNMLILQ